MREITAFSSAMADVALSEPWLGILPIALYGSQDLRDELLPRYMSGRLLPAFALSEPDAGSDAAAITTTASRDGNHYVINGRKTWTSNCGLADVYVVFARIEGQVGAGGIAAFAVDGHDRGMRARGTPFGSASPYRRDVGAQGLPCPRPPPDRRDG
jgi:acyl-CoA dehydrogenase